MFSFTAELTGISSMLMHADNLEMMEGVNAAREAIKADKTLKDHFKGGDDRVPAWTFRAYMYSDGTHVSIPMDNIVRCLSIAGKDMPKGRKGSNYSKVVAAGIVPVSEFAEFYAAGKQVELSAIDSALKGLGIVDYGAHVEACKPLGFRLWAKRAKVGTTKHVRVRPRFDDWKIVCQLQVVTEDFDKKTLTELFDIAGTYVGLGDWRPKSPLSPGPFGRFTAKLTF